MSLPGDQDVGLTPVDLGLLGGVVDLGDERLARLAELAPTGVHVAADGALADVGPVLLDEALEDPPGAVALLGWRLAVGDKPPVDQRMEGPERRGRAALGALSLRRDGGVERLADGPPVHPVTLGERPDRQPFVLMVAPDLLEQLHPRSHPFRDLRLELNGAWTVGSPSDGVGPVQAATVGPNEVATLMFKGPDTNVNLHVLSKDCLEIERMLLFRDRLRSNQADRELYERRKRELAQRACEETRPVGLA